MGTHYKAVPVPALIARYSSYSANFDDRREGYLPAPLIGFTGRDEVLVSLSIITQTTSQAPVKQPGLIVYALHFGDLGFTVVTCLLHKCEYD